ncbi:MAG: PQQ-binding-like beta-propeller repeat protein [Treponema sp.]|jgi:outer membrane protein assembly factor BamB|nr:PQQ-binding-like beta-propeller repeat protein [Treponema sp.]
MEHSRSWVWGWVCFIGSTLSLSAQTLEVPLWKQALGGSVIGLPSVQGGSVVVVCDGGNLKAYTQSGRFLWNYYARGRLRPFVTRSREGVSYIGRTTGVLIAVSRTGRELWRVNFGYPLVGPILNGWDGRIFAAAEKKVACYTAAGTLLWYKNLDYSLVLPPQVDGRGGILLTLASGEILNLDGFGTTRSLLLPEVPALVLPLAETALPDYTPGKGALAIDLPLLILFPNGEMHLHGWDSPDFPRLPDRPVAAVSRENQAALTLRNGQVLLLSLSTGEIRWIRDSNITLIDPKTGESGEIHMIYDERGIYMLSQAGAAGFTEEGRRMWFIQIIGASAIPNFSDEGILYSGGNDWVLYAYRLGNRTRSIPQTRYGPPPEGAYGLGSPRSSSAVTPRLSEAGVRFNLTAIAEALKQGRVGDREKEFTAYLMAVAGSVRSNVPQSRVRPPVDFRQRIEAVRLLALLGSVESIPFLAAQFSREPEPWVQTAIAQAIGRIGRDPEGMALHAFTQALLPPAQSTDEQTLLAIASAVGSLCRFSGPPLSQIGIPLLITLAGYEKPPAVRNQALQEMRSLR